MMNQKDRLGSIAFASVLAVTGISSADDDKDKPAANSVNRVQGVKQEAVPSVKNVEPSTVEPAAVTVPEGVNEVDGVNQTEGVKVPGQETAPPQPPVPAGITAEGMNQVDGVNTIKGVKTPGQEAPTPPPAPADNTAKGINQVEGVAATPPNAVQAVPPPPAGAVSTIQAVKGVQGIIAPKQRNLEAALIIQKGGTPAGNDKGPAAAAALLSAPAGLLSGPPAPGGDGRDAFQQFEELKTPGS